MKYGLFWSAWSWLLVFYVKLQIASTKEEKRFSSNNFCWFGPTQHILVHDFYCFDDFDLPTNSIYLTQVLCLNIRIRSYVPSNRDWSVSNVADIHFLDYHPIKTFLDYDVKGLEETWKIRQDPLSFDFDPHIFCR